MLQDSIINLYHRLRLDSYRQLFGAIQEKSGSLSATEAFSADIIHLLGEPTLGQFAQAIGISQPNATYKVNNLVTKGYVEKLTSAADRREVRLRTVGKYDRYFSENGERLRTAVERLEKQLSQEELEAAERVITALLADLEGE